MRRIVTQATVGIQRALIIAGCIVSIGTNTSADTLTLNCSGLGESLWIDTQASNNHPLIVVPPGTQEAIYIIDLTTRKVSYGRSHPLFNDTMMIDKVDTIDASTGNKYEELFSFQSSIPSGVAGTKVTVTISRRNGALKLN